MQRVRPCDTRRVCRWLAYYGASASIEQVLYSPKHSLIDQSLHSQLGATTTNGDGFGLGWYDDGDEPAVFRSIEPAWNDRNLRELARHTRSRLVLAHLRAATGTAVQQSNCHPFRHGRWLWMHNGLVRDFPRIKRELVFAVAPELYPDIEGSTDSETLFYLALTFGLEDDPPAAVRRAVGLVEAVGREHGVELAGQMTVATTNGDRLWAFRYSTEHDSRSLFVSRDVDTLRELYPENELFRDADEETRLIVSEPLSDLPGVWVEVPESSYGVVGPGGDEIHEFVPDSVVSV